MGHGAHTSPTVVGGMIEGSGYMGLAEGVARGGVPNARIAIYKVCWFYGCSSADILKAFDMQLPMVFRFYQCQCASKDAIDFLVIFKVKCHCWEIQIRTFAWNYPITSVIVPGDKFNCDIVVTELAEKFT
ncbi:hypothetical protein ACH5RR_039837 [Cinchona calisaya]|uniref:Uncharacterized protein n=1 Tax=Cinchona calisaya TaxID=153742 RepID=A0ABD2XZF8_9GENT